MKRVLIDCRFAGTQSGLGRYTRELVAHLLQRQDDIDYVLLVDSEEQRWLQKTANGHKLQATSCTHYSLSEQFLLPSLIRRSGADLFFAPHFNIPLLCPIPFIVTIHDLILHHFPNNASALRRWGYRRVMRHAVMKSHSVITVSHFVQHEIEDAYGTEINTKIHVIPEAAAARFTPRDIAEQQRVRARYNLPEQFFLYVGNAKEHKNVPMLLEAHRRSGVDTPLVLVTGDREVERLSPPHSVVRVPRIDDEDLPAVYSAARCFVTASFYEGFCLPVAEAQACGCPIIALQRSAIPEVAGPDALLVEPTVESLVQALRHAPDRGTAIRGRTWDEAAAETALVLLQAIPSP